jgi:hypothetical protein
MYIALHGELVLLEAVSAGHQPSFFYYRKK